jgi:PAP2 superfamily
VALSIVLLSGGLVWAIGNNGFLAFQLTGSFLIHMSSRPSRREIAATLILGAILRILYGAIYHFDPYFGSVILCCGSFLGLASLIILFAQAARKSRRHWSLFLTAGAFPYCWIFIGFSLARVAHTPRTYDPLLMAFDTSLGASISFILGKSLLTHPLLHDITSTVYNAVGLGASGVLAWYHQARWKPVKALPLYISTMVIGYTTYWIFPAAGPGPAYHSLFPLLPPDKWQILGMGVAPFFAPRNAMPSLHFGAMLLLIWNSRQWPSLLRYAAGLLAAGVAFATLALGEHYLIDLVVAFPFMMAIQAMWTVALPLRDPRRYQPLAAGFLISAAWLIALRWATPSFLATPALGWICVLMTIGVSVALEVRLARAASSPDSCLLAPDSCLPGATIEACPHSPSPRRAAQSSIPSVNSELFPHSKPSHSPTPPIAF